MKARKKIDLRLWAIGRWAVAMAFSLFAQIAASQSFSGGKNLFQLQQSIRGLTASSRLNALMLRTRDIGPTAPNSQAEALSAVFLPRWSAECLPFFCRIEHDFAKKSPVPFKFRLGSVEYVDWLEGKGDWKPLSH